MKRSFVVLLSLLALAAGGALAGIAGATFGGHHNPGHHQYNPKPGCGPWKTDGLAGGSGWHTGQPPKAPNRADCPKPPECSKKVLTVKYVWVKKGKSYVKSWYIAWTNDEKCWDDTDWDDFKKWVCKLLGSHYDAKNWNYTWKWD